MLKRVLFSGGVVIALIVDRPTTVIARSEATSNLIFVVRLFRYACNDER